MVLDAFQPNIAFVAVLVRVLFVFGYATRCLVESQRYSCTDMRDDPRQPSPSRLR
jgi:hypothetical protein